MARSSFLLPRDWSSHNEVLLIFIEDDLVFVTFFLIIKNMKPTQHHFSVPQFQLHMELELQICNLAAWHRDI